MKLIDGKAIAAGIKDQIAREVRAMIDRGEEPPHLAAVLVGEDPASHSYVKSKEKACAEVGFTSSVYRLPANVRQEELLEVVDFLNQDGGVDGFIVQLPLPDHIPVGTVIERIDPRKDVDGFHPVNIGRMVQGEPAYLPATPFGILMMLEKANIATEGKHCVVLGRSNIVGTPMSILLSRKANPGNATVTLCHSKTNDLASITRQADILIAAIGQPGFVKADMVKQGAVVIDVGIHRVPSAETSSGYRLTGDVDFDSVAPRTSWISPVPGGVGLLTVVGLLQNTLLAARGSVYPLSREQR
ncbi:MAG TPA: bifunctional methylenetetrahydrofolate dehydrogenase/methenyltetrahydrofolate cyclohydrolase FolD [Bacteroidales bacterium]|nr:bifunctional methylenetetrahydrofolate dehydrogenase/methenyltetrahydrofolate cyclohydrolase FolD [Bacteroidales bacterium]